MYAVSFPSDMILHLREAAKMAEVTDDLIIVIANSSTLTTLFHLFVRVYNRIGRRLRLVNTEEEAYTLLQMHCEIFWGIRQNYAFA